MVHVHIYATRFPSVETMSAASHRGNAAFIGSGVQPARPRDWLLRPADKIAATVETPEAAAAWHAQWIEDNPRPSWHWGSEEPDVFVERARRMLAERGDRVDMFHLGDEALVATFIPCPTVCGQYACPVGRSDGPGSWGGV